MSRKKNEEAEKDNTERWLLSYADFITLLMIFFVVMYSMSQVDVNKFKAVAASLNIALGGGSISNMEIIKQNPSGSSIIENGSLPPNKTGTSEGSEVSQGQGKGQGDTESEKMTLEGIKAKIDKFAKDNGIQTQLVSSIEERGLVVSIQDTLLFESGSADISSKAGEVLMKISSVLASAPNYIKVEGHTDNLPINTARFHSNWELSAIRATNVLQIMQTAGNISPARLSASEYGEHRPVATNDTEEGRQKNRRVDLVVLRSQYDLVEPGQESSSTSTSGSTASGSNSSDSTKTP